MPSGSNLLDQVTISVKNIRCVAYLGILVHVVGGVFGGDSVLNGANTIAKAS